jgi:ABC-type cobalt transport system substrate-binding protein
MMSMMRSFVVCALLLGGMGIGLSHAGEKWPGVDEAVVNRIAREHGRGERPSLIPAAEGDLQLLLFLMAGTVGGFVAGYYWRVLLEGKQKRAGGKPTR